MLFVERQVAAMSHYSNYGSVPCFSSAARVELTSKTAGLRWGESNELEAAESPRPKLLPEGAEKHPLAPLGALNPSIIGRDPPKHGLRRPRVGRALRLRHPRKHKAPKSSEALVWRAIAVRSQAPLLDCRAVRLENGKRKVQSLRRDRIPTSLTVTGNVATCCLGSSTFWYDHQTNQ